MRWTSLISSSREMDLNRSGAPCIASVLAVPNSWSFLESGQANELTEPRSSPLSAQASPLTENAVRVLPCPPGPPDGQPFRTPQASGSTQDAVRILPCPPGPPDCQPFRTAQACRSTQDAVRVLPSPPAPPYCLPFRTAPASR